MDSDSISLLIIVFCIVMSAYFSATETAFSSLNRIRIKNLAEKGNQRAALVLHLSENYDSIRSRSIRSGFHASNASRALSPS